RRMTFSVGEGTVEAFDAQKAKRLWKLDKLATSLRSADGILFMVQRAGADLHEEMRFPPPKPGETPATPPSRPDHAVVAVDLRTGKPLWEVQGKTLGAAGPGHAFSLDAAGLGAITVSHDNGAKTSILSAKDGTLLGQVQARCYAALHDGAIHLGGKKFDPATGKELDASPIRLGATICTPSYYVNNIIISNRMGTFNLEGKPLVYGGARGGCLFASVPAYGAFYTPQNWCGCAPAQISGFISFGPIAHEPSEEEMEQAPLVEKGSAVTEPGSIVQSPDDWPMYRHDAERSNATPALAPEKIEPVWQRPLTVPAPDGRIGADWRERLCDPLTAPVTADGIVVAAATDRNQVIALDAASGRELWRRTVGGRVDTPPTLHQGLCLFGSHDGYVYALSCKDGQVAWRMRAAPGDERMVSYGKVESPWPVVGTVLVSDGVGYASAGQTQGSDGGIVVRAFDPANGAILWSKVIAPVQEASQYREMRRNDLMLKVGDSVQLMLTRLNPKTGEFMANPTVEYGKYMQRVQRAKLAKAPLNEEPRTLTEIAPSIGLDGFMSANWTRLGTRKHVSMNLGNASGCMLSWNEQIVCAYLQNVKRISSGYFYLPRIEETPDAKSQDSQSIRAIRRDGVKPSGQPLVSNATQWEAKLP
ncbi:MAG: hypothetical protein FJ279_33980, partial [Planctomycetes bacterium]|nr:hypothetical protein [Planctomycetota bacterium]